MLSSASRLRIRHPVVYASGGFAVVDGRLSLLGGDIGAFSRMPGLFLHRALIFLIRNKSAQWAYAGGLCFHSLRDYDPGIQGS